MDAVTALGPERCALAAVPSAALAVLLAAVVANPASGLRLAPARVLDMVWANVRHVIAPLTER